MRKTYFLIGLLLATTLSASAVEKVRKINLPSGGYVVLDADDHVIAKGDGKEMSKDMRWLLASQDMEVVEATAPAARVAQAMVVKDSVGPILGDIMFDQGAPYNRQTPLDRSNNRCVTGCVATAMSQIMTYHRWPLVCNPGSVNYTTATQQIQVSYTYDNVSFNWDLILPTYVTGPKNYTEEQANEVAKLMAAAGAAVEMDYESSRSGTQSRLVPDALVTFFKYKLGIRFESKEDFSSEADFFQALINEFKAARPVYMAGDGSHDGSIGGHAFVTDGYMTYEGAEQYPLFHFNFGWNGYGNEWCMLRNMDYREGVEIIRGIVPDNGTGVDEVAAGVTSSAIYNLLGQQVSEMVPGQIYICGGKKILAH